MNDQDTQQLIVRVKQLEDQMRLHRHLGSDNTQKIIISTPTIYPGNVTSGAAGAVFPPTWTMTHPSTGFYSITHNLGTTNYVVSLAMAGLGICQIYTRGSSSFNINTKNTAFADADLDFDFLVTTH